MESEEDTRQFIQGLQTAEAGAKGRAKRGPFLVEMEYELRLSRTPQLVTLLGAYFERFGSKPCCYDDMRKYCVAASEAAGTAAQCADACRAMAACILPVIEWQAASWDSECAAWKLTCLCRIVRTMGINEAAMGDAAVTQLLPSPTGVDIPDTQEPELEPEVLGGNDAEQVEAEAAAAANEAREAQSARQLRLLEPAPFVDESELGALIRLYFCSLKTLKPTMENTELRVSDRALILVVATLYDKATQAVAAAGAESGLRYLVEGVALLRDGLVRSPYNFKMKLMLLLLYYKLGDFPSAWDLWSSLNVRHIQYDTLLYLALAPALGAGALQQASSLCRSASTLYRENRRDVPEQIINAYRHNYAKVLDFVHLQGRLTRSHTKLRTEAEGALLRLLLEPSGLEEAAAAEIKAVRQRCFPQPHVLVPPRVHGLQRGLLPAHKRERVRIGEDSGRT